MPTLGEDIIPSHLVLRSPEVGGESFGNIMLRMGEVYEIIQPDDDRSFSKKVIEYSVFTQHRANSTAVTKMYQNCFLINSLAGLADECTFTLRADTAANRKQNQGLGLGSKVLMLCINGETRNAVILGGIRDQQSTYDTDNKKAGHHFHWLFNGIGFDVNDDGELTIKYNGKTKIDGTPDSSVKSSNQGTTISLTKDGNLTISSGDGKEAVVIDNQNHQVVIKHQKGVLTGAATDHTLLGDSFRNAQQQEHTKLQAQFKQLQTLLQTAGSALTSAGTSMVTPITGAVAAGPQITAAAGALIAAATAAGNLGQAIADFEQAAAQKNSFVSQYNKSD